MEGERCHCTLNLNCTDQIFLPLHLLVKLCSLYETVVSTFFGFLFQLLNIQIQVSVLKFQNVYITTLL